MDGKLYIIHPPAQHHHILHAMHKAGIKIDHAGAEQGFVTEDQFEALEIAIDAGQLITKTDPKDCLFSEDLW